MQKNTHRVRCITIASTRDTRSYPAASCAIPSFWKLSTELPLAAPQGWRADSLSGEPSRLLVHLSSYFSCVDFLQQKGTGCSSFVSHHLQLKRQMATK